MPELAWDGHRGLLDRVQAFPSDLRGSLALACAETQGPELKCKLGSCETCAVFRDCRGRAQTLGGKEEPQFPFSAGLVVIFKQSRFDVMFISISCSLMSTIFFFMWGY